MKRRRDGSMSLHRPWRRLAWFAVSTAMAVSLHGTDARPVIRAGTAAMATITDVSSAGCGFMSWPKMAETSYAAVLRSPSGREASSRNKETTRASACGRCARVWCNDDLLCWGASTAAVKSAVVYIVEDQRPHWYADPQSSASDLNLSPQAFQNLTDASVGRVPVRWRFIDCPPFDEGGETLVSTPVTPPDPIGCVVCVHGNSSAYWLALQPVNDTLGVSTLRVNGRRATRIKESLNYLFDIDDPNGRISLTQLEISITTRSRRRFSRLVAVKPGSCVALRRSDEQPNGAGDGGSTGSPTNWPTTPVDDDGGDEEDDGTENGGNGNEILDDVSMPNNGAFIVTRTDLPFPVNNPTISAPVVPTVPAVVSPVASPPALTPSMTSDLRLPSFTVRPPTDPASPPVASIFLPPPAPSALVSTFSPLPRPPSSPAVAPPQSPPAIQTFPSLTPPPIDKGGGRPTPRPADTGIFGSTSGVFSKSPPLKPTSEPCGSPPPSTPSSSPPLPTIGRTPVVQLSGGVLTNPLFIGLLLGTVGLVGAVVAYRAKTSQRQRLALVPPASGAVHRTDFTSL